MTKPAQPKDLREIVTETDLSCDVLIIGGGPAGLSVARGLENAGLDILVLESGDLSETSDADQLNQVIVGKDNWTAEQIKKREQFHSPQTQYWSHESQAYGVRCRALGGSTAAWAGKSAAFDEIDFAHRQWVPNSGWPISRDDLSEHLDRAAEALNLNVNCYDDALWSLMGRQPPNPSPDQEVLRSFFWQFARSKLDPMDVMRVGKDFLHQHSRSCRVLTGATVTKILTNESASRATGAIVVDQNGVRKSIKAASVVLAASALENARLLLISNDTQAAGLGNANDTVGKYLLDHPAAPLAKFHGPEIAKMAASFGFFGLKNKSGTSMYLRGLAPTQAVQERENLLNCAVYFQGERAPDDPWIAAKRILKRKSPSYSSDLLSVLKSPGMVTKGLGKLSFQNKYFPKRVSHFIVNQVIRFKPNFVAEEYLTQGVPHKLNGLTIQAVCEQVPDKNNFVELSEQADRFGTPLPRVRWRTGDQEANTMFKLAQILIREFDKAGLPKPQLESWISGAKFKDASVIDMAHSAGTTRMSDAPKTGVVDKNCQVHGVQGLFVAGASIFPTSGHANPTLMIMAFSYRLADHLKTWFNTP